MKKWKIKGGDEFQDLLAKLNSDNKITNNADYNGDSSNLFYGIEDNVLATWDLDDSEHLSYEEVTVEELEKLYYSNNINDVNAEYVKYVGVNPQYYRIPGIVYKVNHKSGGRIDSVICNVKVAEFLPGQSMFISYESNWVAATEAEYLAQVESTIEKWSVGSYIVWLTPIKKGNIERIIREKDSLCTILEHYGSCCFDRERDGEIQWFATKQEAEDFVKTLTTEQTEKERLLAEALRRYPVGTKFKSVCDGNRVREIQPYNEEESLIWKVNLSLTEVRSDNGIKTFGEFCSNPTIYENGKWAEIVEETVIPTEPEKSKYLIAAEKALKHFEDAGFYVGCKYEDTKGDVFVSHRELKINQSDYNECYIDCGSGFLWEYQNEEECLDVYGKLIIEDKPQSIEREFQVGDRVECVEQYNHVSVGMQGVIVEVGSFNIGVSWDTLTTGHSCDGNCTNGTGYYVGVKNIKLISTTTISNSSPKLILNTYGLQVGDELDAKIISAWSGKTGNRSTDTKTEWHQHEGSFVGNRKIINFYLIHGQVGFEVSDTGIVYLKAEGFKEFNTLMHQRERLMHKKSNQTQELLTLPTNKIYVRKSKSIK